MAASGLSVRDEGGEGGGGDGSVEKGAAAMEWEGIGFGWLGCPGVGGDRVLFLSLSFFFR